MSAPAHAIPPADPAARRRAVRAAALAAMLAVPATQARAAAGGLRFSVTYDASITDAYSGRVYVMLASAEGREPRFGPSWFRPEPFFALDVEDWRPGEAIVFDEEAEAFPAPVTALARGTWSVQAVMRRDPDSPFIGRGEKTAYSAVLRRPLDGTTPEIVELHIDRTVGPAPAPAIPRLRVVELRSELLSDFHDRDVVMRAAVLLPESYQDDPQRRYPALYVIPGFGGNHLHVLRFARRGGPGAEGLIRIGLDASCRTGHHVFADSANNGPRGRALVEELIPHLEERFRLAAAPTARFLTGASSGGWSGLWLQVTRPDFFGGVWSLVPDPVDFRAFQLINLYEPGASMYVDDAGRRVPIARRRGEPALWYDDFAAMEVVWGEGGQLGSFEAVFSPRGADGRPRPLFDRDTGAVDPEVAAAWRRYDIRLVLKRQWATLGPKLAGKLHVFAGEADNFYLEDAVRLLQGSLRRLGSDAVVEILPGRNHMTVLSRPLVERIEREALAVFERHHAPSRDALPAGAGTEREP